MHEISKIQLLSKKKLVVFTGAGISAESGLSTFRDQSGLWNRLNPLKWASIGGWIKKPKSVLDFYNQRRKQLLEVEPNHAHKLLAELENLYDITIITQNVDNLHERAGSSHVIHLHGELTKVTSSTNRLDPDCIKEYPLDKPILIGDKAEDGSQLRPFIVWFGESPYAMEVAIDYIKEADIFVVIGTSLEINPAASLIHYVRPATPCYIIDPADLSDKIPDRFIHIKETATKGIDLLFKHKLSNIYTPNTPIYLIRFFRNEQPDNQGRYHKDILQFNHEQIESYHDFIQWILPTIDKSRFHPEAPKAHLQISVARKAFLNQRWTKPV